MNQLSEHAIETYRSLIKLSREAFKALQLLNGGAIVALLAYLGQSADRAALARVLVIPFAFFILGLLAATLAYGTAYLTQFALYNEDLGRPVLLGMKHQWWLGLTILISLGSLALFGFGAFASLVGMTHSC